MKKENILKKVIGKYNLKKLPLYYNSMEEMPRQSSIHTAYSLKHEGAFFIPTKYHKPISRIIKHQK